MAAAARVRDAGLEAAGRPGVVTYSKKVFIPLTRLCRDRCHYCTFATTPNRLPAPFLSPDEVLDIARKGAAMGCKEALFTLGDRPEDRWDDAKEWLEAAGYDSTLEYVRAMSIRVLEETGTAPPPQPRRHELEGDVAAQARRSFDGHDARDDQPPAVRGEGPGALRQPRQGPGRTHPRARGRRSPQHPVHDRTADRHRRDARGSRREHLRAAPDRPYVRLGPGSHHPELRLQGRHRDAWDAGPAGRGVPRRDRDDPHPDGSVDAGAGAAQPRRPRRLPLAARLPASTTSAASAR